jgi:RNA polymerase sigma-32 factor
MALPALEAGGGFTRYMNAIKSFPMLTPDEEIVYGRKLRENDNEEAAYQLVTSHLRLVAKIAMRYRGYGLPISDVISEGNIGLMQAVKRFDPDRGFRLATYAAWWIKATIHEYILRSWSVVRIAASNSQKRLFFNLRRLKSKIGALEDGDMKAEQVTRIARRLNASEAEVIDMNRRLQGDMSLNAKSSDDEEDGLEWQDRLADDMDVEDVYAERSESARRRQALEQALSGLSAREQRIIRARWLTDDPLILDELSAELGISRERVRQVEERAIQKVRIAIAAILGGAASHSALTSPTQPSFAASRG